MDTKSLATLLFDDSLPTLEEITATYPRRELKEGAKVTRMAPSPTGFMHLGNLYAALTSERLAHLSDGVFYLRIEDTDQKREVEGGVQAIIDGLSHFGLNFDEGALVEGEKGIYGPYRQRQRAKIYQAFAKDLVEKGMAYPCFCTEDELVDLRSRQEAEKEDNLGYRGKWAKCRSLSLDEVQERLAKKMPWVLRFKIIRKRYGCGHLKIRRNSHLPFRTRCGRLFNGNHSCCARRRMDCNSAHSSAAVSCGWLKSSQVYAYRTLNEDGRHHQEKTFQTKRPRTCFGVLQAGRLCGKLRDGVPDDFIKFQL